MNDKANYATEYIINTDLYLVSYVIEYIKKEMKII